MSAAAQGRLREVFGNTPPNCSRLNDGVVISDAGEGKCVVQWLNEDKFLVHSIHSLRNEGMSGLSQETISDLRSAYFTDSSDPVMMARKQKLLDHLREKTFVELRPSSIHGLGVFAACPIPEGVDPFQTNRQVTNEIIDLTEEELSTLPERVQRRVKDFVIPHTYNEQLLYGVPEAGLNCLDVSWYANSGKLGGRQDARSNLGYVRRFGSPRPSWHGKTIHVQKCA